MRCEIIDRRSRLEALQRDWWQLWRDAAATPFQSPAWLTSWFDCFAAHSELQVVTLWEGPELVAVCPLFLYDWQGQQRAAPLGAGISDYLDALVAPGAAHVVAAPLRRALEHVAARVDRLQFDDVPEGSVLRELSESAPEACCVCPAVELTGSFDAYLRTLPQFLRRNLRQGGARLARRGTLEWQAIDAGDIQRGLSALFELHTARWRALGEAGVLHDDSVQQFHRSAAPQLAQASALRLLLLLVDHEPVAALYLLRGRDAYYYASGFDPELQDCSLGSLLIARALDEAFARGARRFDFLRGGEAYKYQWGAKDHFTWRVTLQRSASPATAAAGG